MNHIFTQKCIFNFQGAKEKRGKKANKFAYVRKKLYLCTAFCEKHIIQ